MRIAWCILILAITTFVNAFEMRPEAIKKIAEPPEVKQHCLIFEDHFNNLDPKKWQVKKQHGPCTQACVTEAKIAIL